MAGRLPKVTEYIKNVGKSVGYAAIDAVKEPTETMTDFMETNDDLFKVIYSATKNYKRTIRMIDRSIKQSKIYEAAGLGIQNIKDDLKTGKLYNKQREDQQGMEGFMGSEFADFSDFETDEANYSYDEDDYSDESVDASTNATVKAMSQTANGLSNSIIYSSQAQSEVIIGAADSIMKTNIAASKLASIQNEKISSNIVAGFSGVQAGLSTVNAVLTGPMTQFMNESTKFYGDVSTKLNEISAYLRETTEMQRNLYKQQENAWKNSKYDEVVGGSGAPDLTAYAKRIYKNILEFDPTGGMLTGQDKDENIFKALVGSPLKFIPQYLMKFIIPTTVTKALQSFDEHLQGLFPTMIARFNKMAEDEMGDLNIKGILGSILGIKIDKKTSISPGKYPRGPIPFDGETKKAIVDVIPAYLARIESAVSGMPERIFDSNSGTFKLVSEVHRDYKNIEERGYNEAVSSLQDIFEKWAKERVQNDSRLETDEARNAQYAEYKKQFRNVGKQIYRDGGDFRPYQGFGPKGDRTDAEQLYTGPGMFDEDDWKSFMRAVEEQNKKAIWQVSQNTIDAIQRANREMERAEGGFANPFAALWANQYSTLDRYGKITGLNPNQKEIYSKNPAFKSTTDYLKDILAEVRYIRMYGLSGKAKHGPGKTRVPEFGQFKNSMFEDDDFETQEERVDKLYWEKQEKEKTLAEKAGITKENLAKTEAGQKVTTAWEDAKKKIDELMKSPAKFAVEIIHKADQRVYELMFGNPEGETFRDRAGLEYRGFLDYLVSKTEDVFDDFKDKMKDTWGKFKEWFMKTNAGKWIANNGKKLIKSTGSALRSKFGYAKNRVKGAWNNTYGKLIDKAKRGIVDSRDAARIAQEEKARAQADMESLANTFGYGTTDYLGQENAFNIFGRPSEDDGYDYLDDQYMAYGGRVNKYGLTMLSPGEIVIPNPTEAMRKKNLAGEKKEKSRILQALKGGNISHHAEGTVINNGKKEESAAFKAIKKVMHEISGEGGDIAADALIGGGVSLITGMFGGPLLGAAAGAGIGIIKNSETVKKSLFGEMGDDGKRKGGLISKELQDKFTGFFNKNGKSMIDFGIAGGLAGLFTPLGLVGGTIAGAAAGYVKNTEWFQETMFGNEVTGKKGLMSRETQEKLKKAFPAMAIGAGAGALLGPFGLLGNAVLGAGAGYVVTSEKFRELILGVKGDDGKRKGGLAGAIKDGLIKPIYDTGRTLLNDMKDFAKKHIIDPTKNLMEAAGQMVRNMFLSIGDRVADRLSGMFEKHVGMPFEEFMREKVFKRVAGGITGLLKGGAKVLGTAIGIPFGAAGGLGNTIKARQIARGTMDTMTAAQRNEFREKHGIRLNKFTGRDRMKDVDEILATMNAEDLESFGSNIQTFIKSRGTQRMNYNNMIRSTGDSLTEFLNQNNLWDKKNGVNGYNLKSDIMKLMQTDNLNETTLNNLISTYGLSADQAADLMRRIDIGGLNSAREAMINESGMTKEAIQQLEQATGIKNLHSGKNIRLRRLNRLVNTELKARNAANNSGGAHGQVQMTPDEQTADNTKKMISILISINNSLNNAGQVLDENGNPASKAETKEEQRTKNDDKEPGEVTPGGDDKASTDARNKEKKEEKEKSKVRQMWEEFIGKKDAEEEEEKETPSLISRILGGAGSAFSNVFGGIKGKIGTIGMIAGGAVGLSLLGYGGDFLKTKVTPWMKEHVLPIFRGMYEKLLAPVLDGRLVSKMIQGVSFVFKNVAAPLTAAILKSFPSLIVGIAKGIGMFMKDMFKGSDITTSTDYSTYLNSATKSMITGKDEAEIAKDFGGSVFKGMSSAKSEIDRLYSKSVSMSGNEKFDTGTTTLNNGATVDVSEDGTVAMKDKNGNLIGEYNQETGDIQTTVLKKERTGIARRFAGNAFKRSLATGKAPAIVSGAINLGNKLFTSNGIKRNIIKGSTGGLLGGAVNGVSALFKTGAKVTGETAGVASKLGTKINSLLKKTKIAEVGTDLVSSIRGTAKNAIKNGADDAAGAVAKGASKLAKTSISSGFLSGLTSKVTKFFTWLGTSKLVNSIFGVLGKSVTKLSEGALSELFTKAGQKFGQMIAQKGATKLAGQVGTKLLSALGNTTPLALGFWIKSFLDGAWFKTESLLGVAKDTLDITPGMRVLVGLTNAINENLLLGLIPMESIMDVIIGIFGSSLSIDSETLEAAKKETAELVTASGFESGDIKSLEEYNGQQGILKKSWNKIKSVFSTNKDTGVKVTVTDNSSTSGTGRSVYSASGKGRGGQQGGIYSRMRYGNSTIGEAGCAPVAAASMLGGNIPEAARFAQRTGHVASDGSTDIGFFNDYFSAKGISNRTTTNKSDVSKALRNGQSAVMLGRDPGGGNESAYSNSSHFITARGDRHGNVIVNDPALGMRKMPQSKVMKNMKASVLTGRGRTWEGTNEEVIGRGNVQKIVDIAKSQIGYREKSGNNTIYGEEYGLNYNPWCCMFVWWVFKHAGASSLFYGGGKTASCTTLMTYYRAKGQEVRYAKKGDLIFMNFDKKPNSSVAQHIGICIEDSDGLTVKTVEGNTSDSNSGSQDNGDGVCRKTRKVSQIVSIARPAYAGAKFDDAIPYQEGTYYNYSDGESESTDSSSGATGLIDKIVSLGKLAVKSIFGEGLYNAVFGEGTDASTTNDTRNDVSPDVDPNIDPYGNLTGSSNEEKIWTYLRSKGYSKQGTAAIMGSLINESGLKSNNLQNSYNTKFGLTDDQYTEKVNEGTYSKNKFMNDNGGYGLAQWTYNTRKQALYDATVSKGRPINGMKDQLDLLDKEVSNYGLSEVLKNATKISDANNVFIHDFEKPAGSGTYGSDVYTKRLQSANEIYDKYKGTGRGYNGSIDLDNERGGARDDSIVKSPSTSYTQFLEAIINILISISDNTEALSKILDILSTNFNIDVNTSDVKKSTSDSKTRAKEALRDLMANKGDAEELSNILQTKDTNYLISVMTDIARE